MKFSHIMSIKLLKKMAAAGFLFYISPVGIVHASETGKKSESLQMLNHLVSSLGESEEISKEDLIAEIKAFQDRTSFFSTVWHFEPNEQKDGLYSYFDDEEFYKKDKLSNYQITEFSFGPSALNYKDAVDEYATSPFLLRNGGHHQIVKNNHWNKSQCWGGGLIIENFDMPQTKYTSGHINLKDHGRSENDPAELFSPPKGIVKSRAITSASKAANVTREMKQVPGELQKSIQEIMGDFFEYLSSDTENDTKTYKIVRISGPQAIFKIRIEK